MTRVETWNGLVVAVCEPDGALLAGVADINDFLSLAFEANADWLAMPVTRLGEDFLRAFVAIKTQEWHKYQALVPPTDHDWYLDSV